MLIYFIVSTKITRIYIRLPYKDILNKHSKHPCKKATPELRNVIVHIDTNLRHFLTTGKLFTFFFFLMLQLYTIKGVLEIS